MQAIRLLTIIALISSVHLFTIFDAVQSALGVMIFICAFMIMKLAYKKQFSGALLIWGGLCFIFSISLYFSLNGENDWVRIITLPPILINLSLGFIFTISLLGQNTAIITRIRLLEEKEPKAKIILYTRRLTAVWALLFWMSSSILIWGIFNLELRMWSWLANIIIPSISIMFFLIEHAYRALNKDIFGETSPIKTIKLMLSLDLWRQK